MVPRPWDHERIWWSPDTGWRRPEWARADSYLHAHSEDELERGIKMYRNEIQVMRGKLARAKARGRFYCSPKAHARLVDRVVVARRTITSYSAELRARRGDALAIRRCRWLLTVVAWYHGTIDAWNWAESERKEIERLERALTTGRRTNGEPYPSSTLRAYRSRLPRAQRDYEKSVEKVRRYVAAAPAPYFVEAWLDRQLAMLDAGGAR
jgi:hypothetical protein